MRETLTGPLLAIESPVAQRLEHPTRSWRVVGSIPIWGWDFFPSFHLMQKTYHVLGNEQMKTVQNNFKWDETKMNLIFCRYNDQ